MNDIPLTRLISLLLVSYVTSSCPEGELSCGEDSSLCYHPAYICDGALDCFDTGKDENNCDTHRCQEGEFQCAQGNCIEGRRRCDTRPDCYDSSDEHDCVWRCDESEEFQCVRTGRCIPLHRQCDGTLDCGEFDESDETECDGVCGDRQFHCSRSYTKTCISSKWRCDDYEDCDFGEDEEDCTGVQLPEYCTGLTCDGNTVCVQSDQICDKRRDCVDGTDEDPGLCYGRCDYSQWACGGQGYGYCIDVALVCDGHPHCHDHSDEQHCDEDDPCKGALDCGDEVCVPLDWRCDGTVDCDGGIDEMECDLCEEGEFQCRNRTCISQNLVCDGAADCITAEDEEHCMGPTDECTEGFKCNTTNKCIPYPLLCNTEDDCGDQSDEQPNCEPWDGCQFNDSNGGCDHICSSLRNRTHVCTCHAGHVLGHNGMSCVDIDECQGEVLACSQLCENQDGSYSCDCDTGYTLSSNNKSCVANDTVTPYLIFSNIQMRRTDLEGLKSEVLFRTTLSNIIDYDYWKQEWYWVSTDEISVDGVRKYQVVVSKCKFNDTSGNVTVILSDILDNLNIRDMVVDWVTGSLYVVGRNKSRPMISALNQTSGQMVKLITTHTIDPFSVVLDPRDGLMFWTDIHANLPGTVERASMDGTNRRTIAYNVGWANGITVDYSRRRVVWIDAGMVNQTRYPGRIEEMDYNGHNRRIVKMLVPDETRPWAITLFEDSYYWTDSHHTKEAIFKCNRFNTSITEPIRVGLEVPMAIKIVHPLRQPLATNYCQDKGCSHLCLLREGGGATCLCPEGLILPNATSTTCVPPTRDVICASCPPNVPCVRVSSTGYGCVTNQSDKDSSGEETNSTEVTDVSNKVGSISWWVCLVIACLVTVILIIGVVACRKALSCKACINRLAGQSGSQRLGQEYMHISLQPVSQTVTTELWESEQRNKKESDI